MILVLNLDSRKYSLHQTFFYSVCAPIDSIDDIQPGSVQCTVYRVCSPIDSIDDIQPGLSDHLLPDFIPSVHVLVRGEAVQRIVHCSAVQYSAVQCSAVHYSAVQYSAVQSSVV